MKASVEGGGAEGEGWGERESHRLLLLLRACEIGEG